MASILPSNVNKLFSDGTASRALSTLDNIAGSVQQIGGLVNQVGGAGANFGSQLASLGDILNATAGVGDIINAFGGTGGSLTQAGGLAPIMQIKDRAKNRGTWIESLPDLRSIVSPENTLIGLGTPLFTSSVIPLENISALGLCTSFSFSVSNRIFTDKELRAERTIIAALKSEPGSLTINRLLTTRPTILHGMITQAQGVKPAGPLWKFDVQTPQAKQLFGVLLFFMSADRKDVAALYAEKCAIQSIQASGDASSFYMMESVQLVFDKLLEIQDMPRGV